MLNTRFERRDAAALALFDACDSITAFDAVHDQARPDEVLRGIARRCERAVPTSPWTSLHRARWRRT